jgi:hypothetical protein
MLDARSGLRERIYGAKNIYLIVLLGMALVFGDFFFYSFGYPSISCCAICVRYHGRAYGDDYLDYQAWIWVAFMCRITDRLLNITWNHLHRVFANIQTFSSHSFMSCGLNLLEYQNPIPFKTAHYISPHSHPLSILISLPAEPSAKSSLSESHNPNSHDETPPD